MFLDYDWPGNVRELENVIKRYLILPQVDFDLSGLPRRRTKLQGTPSKPLREFASLKQVGLEAAERAERELVIAMLEQTNWNRKQAAALLQISYKALLYKIRQYGIAEAKNHHRLSAGA